MGLRFENAFLIKAPADRVWAYLTDPYRVAPALPGAAITEKRDDGSYAGTITVKVGPVSAKYKGTVRFDSLDPAAHAAVMSAKGQEASGRGGADMKMESHLVEKAPNETEVTVASDVNVTGLLAQMGRGLMQDVSNQMFQKFTEAMRAELEAPAAAAAEAQAAPPAAQQADGAPGAPPPPVPPAPGTAAPGGRVTREGAPPIEVFSFGTKILARAAGRTMRKPLFWVVAAAVAGAIYWLLR
jgi:carbon monoxide dehydrogenase subunit G